jgi:UDP-glucose 4-epimerase
MILVTGARGFLGRYCLKELYKLRKPLFLTTSNKRVCGDNSDYYYLNLEEPESFSVLPENIDTVIHLAAIIPEKNKVVPFKKFMDVNALAVRRLIETVAMRGCRRFIYASTQMVVEKPFYLPVDEDHPLVPDSDYGLSKAVGERYCQSYAERSNIKVIVLRFSHIFGAGEKPGYVLTKFIERAEKSLPLTVFGSGRDRMDLLYVKDAAKAVSCALHSDVSGIFNIGSGVGISVRELAKATSDVFSNGVSSIEFKHERKDSGRDFHLDIRKAKEAIGFTPKYSLAEGLMDYKSELSAVKRK